MELNKIKKLLYKNNIKAKLEYVTKDVLRYNVEIRDLSEDLTSSYIILHVDVPISEIENGKFYAEEEAKYLIRWIKLI